MDEVKLNTYVRKKDGGWQYIIRYKDGVGKWKTAFSKQGFKDKPEATKAMVAKISEAEKVAKCGLKSNKSTLESFYETHLEHIKLYFQNKTVANYKSMYSHFKILKNKELVKITKTDVQKCVDIMVNEGLKSSTIKVNYNTFITLMRAAKEEYNLITELPKIKLKLDIGESNKKALDKETIHSVINDFNGKYNIYHNLILLFALEAGMRIGEIMGLTYADLDLENRNIYVNRQWKVVGGDYTFGKLKSKNSKRTIPMSNNLYKLLSTIEFKDKNERIIIYKSTLGVSEEMTLKLKKYGVTTHELRHTFCTQLLINGLDIGTTAKLMGHSVDMTLKIYNHIQEEHLKKAGNLINNIF